MKTIPNLFCVVTCQREGAPYIFDKLVKALKSYVIDLTKDIIRASEQTDELVLAEHRELYQYPDVELRSLASVLHYNTDIKRILKTRGTKRRSAGGRREAKRRRL